MEKTEDHQKSPVPVKKDRFFTKQRVLQISLSLFFVISIFAGIIGSTTGGNISNTIESPKIPESIATQFDTDFNNISIEPSLLVSGGPGKDGIPALLNPSFEPISKTKIADTTRGILVDVDGERRFYPYNILVWHEIVNDSIGEKNLAITFCPLCGSAVVYDRDIDGQTVEMKVSGLLVESNMVMYDNISESFFSQSLGIGLAGEHNEKQLERYPFQLLQVLDVKKDFPDSKIMTTNTGHTRDYAFYPYGNYDNQEDIYFPIQNTNNLYSGKEIFYIVPLESKSYAVRVGEIEDGTTEMIEDYGFQVAKMGGVVTATTFDGNIIPSYYEMWFSWATQHPGTDTVYDPSKL